MKKLLLTLLVFSSSLFTLNAQSWLWARQGRNADNQLNLTGENSISIDKYHNVYETGSYTGDTLIFGLDTVFGKSFEVFLVKYDENGNSVWAKSSQTNGTHVTNASSQYVAADIRDNTYIVGEYEDTISFGAFSLYAPINFSHAFLVKYDAIGNVKWAKQSTTPYAGYAATAGSGIALDKSNKYIYMTGDYRNSATFGNDTLNGFSNLTVFLVKYDSNGDAIWTKQGIIGANGEAYGSAVVTDKSGYIYLMGTFNDSITFGDITLSNIGSYQSNLFLVKYDSNGNIIWAKEATLPKGNSAANGGNVLSIDKSGNIYLSGYFYDTVSFGSYTLTNPLSNDYSSTSIFWAKYDSAGNVLWAKQSYSLDTLRWMSLSIANDDKNNLYLAGSQGGSGGKNAKIRFNATTLQDKVHDGSVWLKFDSNGNVLSSYIFSGGGGNSTDPIVVDSSGCYVYFGATTLDTVMVIGNDTVGTYFDTFRPIIARWSPGECSMGMGINNVNKSPLEVNLYPNPNNGIFTLSCHSEHSEESLPIMEVYNMLGQKIYDETLKQVQGDNLIDLNKPSGVYLYRIIDQQNNLLASGKFIIQ